MPKLENSLTNSSSKQMSQKEREILIAHLLLVNSAGGDVVAFLAARLSPSKTFSVLRHLSNLDVYLPDELDAIRGLPSDEQKIFNTETLELKSAGTSRWLKFPDFKDVLKTVERVQCFFLCRRLSNRKEVADQLGWSEKDVKRVDETMCKRLRSLKGIAW